MLVRQRFRRETKQRSGGFAVDAQRRDGRRFSAHIDSRFEEAVTPP